MANKFSGVFNNGNEQKCVSSEISGTKKVIFRISEDAKYQLDYLALELRTTKQSLFPEAINDLLQKHGKQRTA